MPSVLDFQSLGAGFDARTEVYLSVLFLPHLCQQSNYYNNKQVPDETCMCARAFREHLSF